MRIDATLECDLLGEFVCKSEIPPEQVGPDRPRHGKAVMEPTIWLGEVVARDARAFPEKSFKILLKDQRVVTVRGHSVTFLPNAGNPTDAGSYGVLARSQGRDVLVALFRASEVTGVFDGSLQTA